MLDYAPISNISDSLKKNGAYLEFCDIRMAMKVEMKNQHVEKICL